MVMPEGFAWPTECSGLTGPPPWVSHLSRSNLPAIGTTGWGPPLDPPARPCTVPLVSSSTEIPAILLTSTSMAGSTVTSGSTSTPTMFAISSSLLSSLVSTTFLTSTVLLTSSKPETTLAGGSGSPAVDQTSDSGDRLLKVVIAVSVVALVAFLALFMMILKKQSPVRYDRVIVYCPFHMIWKYILLFVALVWPRHHQTHGYLDNRPQALPNVKSEVSQLNSNIQRGDDHSVPPHIAAQILMDRMDATDYRRSEVLMDSRGRSRTERIEGLGIDLVNPAPAEQPGLGRRVMRSFSRSGNNKPFRVSFVLDHKSPRASDASVAWQRDSPFSDEALTPPPLQYSPHFNLRISDFSMASTFSNPSTEDLSTYHSNLSRLKAERAERVRQMGLSDKNSLRVERIDPRRSGAHKSFGLSPGKRFRAYLGASSVSPDSNVSRFHDSKSKSGHQNMGKRMGIDALKAWWDKLGNEQE